MKNKPFIGQFSGFLYIGEEKAEFNKKKLVSYYAKPYCSNTSVKVANCIEFKDGKLTIRDVKSPNGEKYDCIWEQDDIESVLDKLGKTAAYYIEKISCNTIKNLVIPAKCKGISKNAFEDCEYLCNLICFGNEMPELSNSYIRAVQADQYVNDGFDIDNGVELLYDYSSEEMYWSSRKIFGVYVKKECKILTHDDVANNKWVFIWNRNVKIQPGAIKKDATILGFQGSTAEQYAKENGNKFQTLDTTTYNPNALLGVKIENGTLITKGETYLRLNGLSQTQLEKIEPNEKLVAAHEPDKMNAMRVVFRSADTGEFRGVMANRAAFTAAYLMSQGYLSFENILTEKNGYLTADILWREPVTEQIERSLHFLEITQNCPKDFWNRFHNEREYIQYILPFDLLREMKRDGNKLMTNSIISLFETGNRLSFAAEEIIWGSLSSGTVLTPLTYTDDGYYAFEDTSYKLSAEPKSGELSCYKDGKPIKTTPNEEKFAKICIDHYRQIYNLPPIFENQYGGNENGTV